MSVGFQDMDKNSIIVRKTLGDNHKKYKVDSDLEKN